jgi:thiol-disulfide isomerase/thioredoxin
VKKKIFIFSAVAILFGAFGAFIAQRQTEPHAAEATAVANLLSQSMSDASGKTESLAQWKNKVLIVNFWATWCAPCVEEMPELSALQTEVEPLKVQILGIGIDSASNITEFIAKYKISYPLYVAGVDGTEISRQLGNTAGGLPFTVLIGRDGQVKKTYLGRLKINELRKDLTAL